MSETEGTNRTLAPVRDIDEITGEILEAKRVGGQAILTSGRCLIEAKGRLSHGEWLPWLTEKVEFSERAAQNFMRLAKEYSNPQALADLGATKALQLLALPESEREVFIASSHAVNGEEKAVVDMTSRELEKAIRERDEALRAKETAQAEAKAARAARDKASGDMRRVNALLESAQADRDTAAGRISELERELAALQSTPVEVAVMEVDQEKLDRARSEGEAAKAQELIVLQKQLEEAREAKKKAEETREAARESLEAARKELSDLKAKEPGVRELTQEEKDALTAGAVEQARAEDAGRLRALEKRLASADPIVAEFKVRFNSWQEEYQKMMEVLARVAQAGGERAAKLRQAVKAALEQMDSGCQAAKEERSEPQ